MTATLAGMVAVVSGGCSCGGVETGTGTGGNGGDGGEGAAGGAGGTTSTGGGAGGATSTGGGGQGGTTSTGGGGQGGGTAVLDTYETVWVAQVSGGNAQVITAAVDPAGAIVIGGIFSDEVTIGPFTFTGQTDDAFIARLDMDGSALWAEVLSGPGEESVQALAVAPDGTIHAGGRSTQTATFGAATIDGDAAGDGFLLSLGPDGQLDGALRFGGEGSQRITSAAVDDEGNVLVAGDTFVGLTIDGAPVLDQGSVFVGKLAPDGSTQWIRGFGSLAHAGTVAVSAASGVVLTGRYTTEIDLGGEVLPDPPVSQGFAAAFDPDDGAHRWSRGAIGTDGAFGAEPLAVVQKPSGDLWMSGMFQGAIDLDGTPYDAGSDAFFYFARLDTLGAFKGAAGFGNVGLSGLYPAVPGSRADEVLLGWQGLGSVTWGGQTVTSGTLTTFLLGMNDAGEPIKTRPLCTGGPCGAWEIHDALGEGWLVVGVVGNGADLGLGATQVTGTFGGLVVMLK